MNPTNAPIIHFLSKKQGHIGILLFASASVVFDSPFPKQLLHEELQSYYEEIIEWLKTCPPAEARELASATLLDGLMPRMDLSEEMIGDE